MSPIIEAAWIAAGVGALGIIGTVTATIAGTRAADKVAEKTIAGGLAGLLQLLKATDSTDRNQSKLTQVADRLARPQNEVKLDFPAIVEVAVQALDDI
jgi:hypothetical protein